MKQQTAVEWLEQKIFEEFKVPISYQVFEQAKAMEKEQIVSAYWSGLEGPINDYSESKTVGSEIRNIKFGGGAEQYYNKTYGKQEKL